MSAEIKNAIATEQVPSTQELLPRKTNTNDHENLDSLYKKIDLVTEGLDRCLCKQLKEQISVENSAIIAWIDSSSGDGELETYDPDYCLKYLKMPELVFNILELVGRVHRWTVGYGRCYHPFFIENK